MTTVTLKRILNFIKDKFTKVEEQVILNKSSVGLQKKNLLVNKCKSVVYAGISAEIQPDGSIFIKGKHDTSSNFVLISNFFTGSSTVDNQYIDNKKFLSVGNYILSGGGENYSLQVLCSKDNTNSDVQIIATTDYKSEEVKFSITNTEEHNYVWARLLIKGLADFGEGILIQPMIRYSEITDPTYTPPIPDLQQQISATNSVLVEIVDNGQKNLFYPTIIKETMFYNVTIIPNSDGTYTLNGTNSDVVNNRKIKLGEVYLKAGVTYVVSGGSSKFRIRVGKIEDDSIITDSGSNINVFRVDKDGTYPISLNILFAETYINDIAYPMICKKELYDISSKFVPYQPSLQEHINNIPVVKSKTVTSITTENGNLSTGLKSDNYVIISAITKQAMNNIGIVLTPTTAVGGDLWVHAAVADPNNTVLTKTEITSTIYYYEI